MPLNDIIVDRIDTKHANIGTKLKNSKAKLEADSMHIRGNMVSEKIKVENLNVKDKFKLKPTLVLPNSPVNGTIVYNSQLQQLQIYSNNEWKPLIHNI